MKASLLALLASAALADDPTFNYDKHGSDWTDFKTCMKATSIQSPIKVTHDGTDWYNKLLL
jgi:hypothetical protein